MPSLLAVLAGFGTGMGLIVAIGAQNAHLLRLGASGSRRTVAAAIAICAGSDAVLIVAGVLGVGVVVQRLPVALLVARIVGAGFLLVVGALAARRALRPAGTGLVVDGGLRRPPSGGGPAARRALLVMVVLTWANPHVYLDTLLLLGSVANQQGPLLRWWWVLGAVTASWAWFSAIGFGSRLLRPLLARPGVWRVVDGMIAVVMAVLGTTLLIGA